MEKHSRSSLGAFDFWAFCFGEAVRKDAFFHGSSFEFSLDLRGRMIFAPTSALAEQSVIRNPLIQLKLRFSCACVGADIIRPRLLSLPYRWNCSFMDSPNLLVL